jgi:hypothetical protein
MANRGRKKIKDLVEMLESPEDTGYIGGDFEDMIEEMERELSLSEEDEDGEFEEEDF